jgi:hypothetical protein
LLGHISEEAQGILQDRQHATQTIKEKLIKAQERIKKYDYKSKERELQGDMLHNPTGSQSPRITQTTFQIRWPI